MSVAVIGLGTLLIGLGECALVWVLADWMRESSSFSCNDD